MCGFFCEKNMAIQQINLGAAPTGAGGDTSRSANVKVNENFTNPQHAASRMVGVGGGNVMEVGAFGVGAYTLPEFPNSFELQAKTRSGFYYTEPSTGIADGQLININRSYWLKAVHFPVGHAAPNLLSSNTDLLKWSSFEFLVDGINTTIDSNGFIKKASPIIHIFCDRIEPNDEAQEQNPIFEKLGAGHYLIRGTQGFAKSGWWIEVPTDSNGNKVCAVEYQTLENGDLEIKTFKKKLNEDGDIVANLEKPMDIPCNSNGEQRWIDIRLNELPKKPAVMQVPRTEKQPKMVKRIKYAPQLTYITKMEDLIDDSGNVVKVKGRNFQNPVTHIHTDANGTPILTDQPVVNESGETVFEFVQAVDSEGEPVFEDAPVLDADENQITDEVIHEP